MASPAFIQANNNTSSPAVSTLSATFTNAQTKGNTIVAWIAADDTTNVPFFLQSISDTSGNQYRLVSYGVGNSNTAQCMVFVAFGIAAAGAGANTVTFNFTGSPTFTSIIISEYGPAVNVEDAGNFGVNSATTSASMGTITPVNPNTILCSFLQASAAGTCTPSAGTVRQQAGTFNVFLADLAIGSPSATTLSWTIPSGQYVLINLALSNTAPPNLTKLTAPPLGYDTWRTYQTTCTEANAHAQANAVISLGLDKLGYKLFSVSDVVYNARTSGNLVTNSTNFPSGDTALYNFIKSKGLKVQSYLGPGATSCNSFPGSDTFETTDATLLANNGCVFLMYDSCTDFGSSDATRTKYATMINALTATGSSIAIMVSPPVYENMQWGGQQCWGRMIGGDVFITMTDQLTPMNFTKLIALADTQTYMTAWSAPGYYLWPDWLGTANGTMSVAEGRSMFALYCIWPAAIWIDCDLTVIGAADLATISNTEMIAVNQDPLAIGGTRVLRTTGSSGGFLDVWFRPLANRKYAVVFWNRDSASNPMSITWSQLGLTGTFTVRDIIGHSNLGVMGTGYSTTVASHDSAMILLSPVLSVGTSGRYVILTAWNSYLVADLIAGVDYSGDVASIVSGPYQSYIAGIQAIDAILTLGAG